MALKIMDAVVLLESARIYNFKGISRYQGVTGGSVAQPKCQNGLLSRDLRRLEYASSNQGVGGSNPSGRTFSLEIFRQASRHGTSRSNRRQTTRRRIANALHRNSEDAGFAEMKLQAGAIAD